MDLYDKFSKLWMKVISLAMFSLPDVTDLN